VADSAATLVVGSPAPVREVARLTFGDTGRIVLTADGASRFIDGEAAVTIALVDAHHTGLVHLPAGLAASLLGTLESLAAMNRFPWFLLSKLDDPPSYVLANGMSGVGGTRIVFRKRTPWTRPWEVTVIDDYRGAPAPQLRLTRRQLGELADALRRTTDEALAYERLGAWRVQGR
jgi:hypothetical protein